MKTGPFVPLALRKELLFINKNGIILKSNALAIKYLPASENKLAFIVRKKLGNSVRRNLVKRRFRSIITTLHKGQNDIEKNIHCLMIAKPEAFNYSFSRLENETKKIFLKIYNQYSTFADQDL